jgi:hypothetical protein
MKRTSTNVSGKRKPKPKATVQEIAIVEIKPGQGLHDTWIAFNLPAWVVLLIVVAFVVTLLILAGISPDLAINVVVTLVRLAKTFLK